jgi:hypothetical protein
MMRAIRINGKAGQGNNNGIQQQYRQKNHPWRDEAWT